MMSESSQSTSSKRPREDEIGAIGSAQEMAKKARVHATELVHDEEFWYEDGTIILVGRNAEFRVYKGVLADHSSVFADMFSLPQPTSFLTHAAPLEIPSVYLEDSPEDLRHILRALFPKKSARFLQLDADSLTFYAISAYVRLGHKYQIDTLFDQSLAYLKMCFPIEFEARRWWLKKNPYQVPKGWGLHPNDAKVFAIGVVNLARLVQCDAILPSAMAVCCSLEATTLTDGLLREDGTRERLSGDDLKLCIAGVRALTHGASAAVTMSLACFGRAECKMKTAFRRAIQDLLSDHADDSLFFPTSSPFRDWDFWLTELWVSNGACGECLEDVKKRFRAEQRSLWAKLPNIFSITVEGWPEDEP